MKDKKIIKLVQKLIERAMDASDENYSAFVEYAPHISAVIVRIDNNGWKSNRPADVYSTVYLNDDCVERKLDKIIKSIRSEK